MLDEDRRHPSGAAVLRWLNQYDHLPEGPIRDMSEDMSIVGNTVYQNLPDSGELTAGLRKLLEAKDCFVRATVDAEGSK